MTKTRVASSDYLPEEEWEEEEKESPMAAEQTSAFSLLSGVEIRPGEKTERAIYADNSSGFYKHSVFISHRGTRKQDIAFPMMAIFSYFCGSKFAVFDRVTFEPGEENRNVISETLSQSVHCLVLITKDFFQSKWTVKEADAFFRAIEKNPNNPKKRKIIPLFIGLSPAECRSLKKSDCKTPRQSLSEKHFQRCKSIGEQLSQISGLEQHERFEASEEFQRVKDFILNQMSDLLKNYLREGDEPSLLPDFQNQVNPVLLAYIYDEAVSYYQRVNGEVNITNLLNLITKLRLQTSLRAQYAEYNHLERLFDNKPTFILDSFINLALIKETEHRKKEKDLDRGANLEEKDKNEKEFIDERMASHEELYAVKEPLALNQLFEPKDDTKTPNKILILGRAGIGKTTLCQYLAVQWASGSSECKDEEQGKELGNYLRQKFDAVFWIRLREVTDFLKPSNMAVMNQAGHSILGQAIREFCLKGLHTPLPTEIEDYIRCNKDKILFILDGYDEIMDRVTRSESSLLNRFLANILDHQHVLLTSRPVAVDTLGQSKVTFDRKLENIGFTNENIEAYVSCFMRDAEKYDQTEPMLKFLRTHPSIWGIVHIPINLELLSWLWSQGDLVLKQGQMMTLSRLYQIIVDRVQDAYARKFDQLQASLLEESKEGESPSINTVNEFLEYLAYAAMQQESLLISKNQLKEALTKTLRKHHKQNSLRNHEIVLKSATDKLGFLRTTGQGGRSQLDQPHYFIHLSFQEFYAARYITRILNNPIENEEKMNVIQYIIAEKYMPRYQLMLWMTAGLLYQQGVEQLGREFLALEQFWQAILSQPRDLIGFHHWMLVMHCLDECEADDHLPLHKMLIDQQLRWFNFYLRHVQYIFSYHHFTEYEYRTIAPSIDELARCPLLQRSKLMIDHMLKNLNLKEDNINCAAVNTLGRLSNPSGEVINALLTVLLKDKNELMRISTVYALGNLQNPSGEVVNAFLTALKDESANVWGAAGSALGKLHNLSDEVVNALLTALKDKNERIRVSAVCALGNLQNPSGEAVNALLIALKDENRYVREAAVYALGNLQNPSGEAVNALLIALKVENRYVREAAVYALAKLRNLDEMVNTYVTALKDEDEYVRSAAVFALGKLPNPNSEVINVLLTALTDESQVVRSAAVSALGKLPNPNSEVVNVLLTALTDESKFVRSAVVSALGKLPNPNSEVVTVLLTALIDKNEDVREAAVSELDKFSNLSSVVVNVLVTTLKDENQYVRRNAVYALGKLPNPSNVVINVLLMALRDENEYVRKAAGSALANFKKIDHLRLIFERLMYHQSFQIYLSSYFKENHLLCIAYENGQIIISLHNKIHKIAFSQEALIHLEEQVRIVAEQLQYPLDIILLDEKISRLLQKKIQGSHLLLPLVDANIPKHQVAVESPMQYEEEKEPTQTVAQNQIIAPHARMFSNESDEQILKRLQSILENFNNGEIEDGAMRHAICHALQSFQNRGAGYSLNSSRMFRMILKLLHPEKMALKASEDSVQRIILGNIPELEKDKIRRRVADSEFYIVFFKEIANSLKIKCFLSEENVQELAHS